VILHGMLVFRHEVCAIVSQCYGGGNKCGAGQKWVVWGNSFVCLAVLVVWDGVGYGIVGGVWCSL
jgi:hypothetical protein